ncbi:MAG: restriction endonuclease subunit S [Bacteriodetes bacterium]|nr:restriction endonuclease subunit S [Bacteroidota bacterium]
MQIKKFLKRIKIPIDIQDNVDYKRITIRINHQGISLRDIVKGVVIGTKKQFKVSSGLFLLSKIDARYGAFGIIPAEANDAIITGNFWAYEVDTNIIDIEWFNQYTNSKYFYQICEDASSGITHRKYLDEKSFLDHDIVLPSLEKQKKQINDIKVFKTKINSVNTELNHQLELVKKLRQSLLQDAVQGKLLPPQTTNGGKVEHAADLLQQIKAEKEKLIAEKKIKKEKPLPPIKPEEIPFEIPSNWVWCRLGEITLHSQAGKSFKASELPANLGQLGVIKTSAITTGIFLENENKSLPNNVDDYSTIKISKGDLIFCRASGSKGLAGKSCIVTNLINSNLILSDKSIRYLFPSNINKTFVHIVNISTYGESYYHRLGTKKSTSMNNITREQFDMLPIPLPPYSFQNATVNNLDKLLKYCDNIETSIKASQQLNQQLTQQVLSELLQP